MREVTNKLLSLLFEFDNICKSFNFNYIVGGKLPGFIYNNEISDINTISVYMLPKDILKLISLSKKGNIGNNRKIEYIGNNPNYPDFSARYVDISTTYLECQEINLYKYQGMFIELIPIRGKSSGGKKNFLYGNLEKIYEFSDIRRMDVSYYKMRIIIYRIFKLFRKLIEYKIDKIIFKKMCKYYQYNEDNNKVYFKNIFRLCVSMPAEIFYKTNYVDYLGFKVRLPENNKKYCSKLYTTKIKTLLYPKKLKTSSSILIINPYIPYDSILSNFTDIKDYQKECNKVRKQIYQCNISYKNRREHYNTAWRKVKKLYSENLINKNTIKMDD